MSKNVFSSTNVSASRPTANKWQNILAAQLMTSPNRFTCMISLHPVSGMSFIIFVTESKASSLWKLPQFICSLKECLGFNCYSLCYQFFFFWKNITVNLTNKQLGKKAQKQTQADEKLLEWCLSVGMCGFIYLRVPVAFLPPPPFLPHPCFKYTINYSTCSFHRLYLPLCWLHASF